MNDMEQVDIQIEVAKEMIALRDDCVKLMANKNFKDVIEKGYFKEEAARLVMAKSNHTLSIEQQTNMDNRIMGIGALANFLDAIMSRGDQMDQALEGHEQTRQELLAEDIS